MKCIVYILIVILFKLAATTAYSQNIKQISKNQGLSNNAVFSICQDRKGYIWLGTCDGLNQWDGQEMNTYYPGNNENSLSGNSITKMQLIDGHILWLHTNYGLDRFDTETKQVERHREVEGWYNYSAISGDKVIAVTSNGSFFFYNKRKKQFNKMPLKVDFKQLLGIYYDNKGRLWLAQTNGIYYYHITYKEDKCDVTRLNKKIMGGKISSATQKDFFLYVVDFKGDIYEINTLTDHTHFISSLNTILGHPNTINDAINDIIKDGKDYFIAFAVSGTIHLKWEQTKYKSEKSSIKIGTFSLLKDKKQNIIWMGTDGQGLLQFTYQHKIFRSILFHNLPYNIMKPVRSIIMDRNNNLWIGTKGDGILKINNFYQCAQYDKSNTSLITTENSHLINNSVYAMSPGSHHTFWLGTDGYNLNYYSYEDAKIHKLICTNRIRNIHAIHQQNDSTLWVGTLGDGIFKLHLRWKYNRPYITDEKKIDLNDQIERNNCFFDIIPQNDTILWFASRGNGFIQYNTKTNRGIQYLNKKNSPVSNDIFSTQIVGKDSIWLGTGDGLLKYKIKENKIECTSVQHNLHSILVDNDNHVWLGSNNGLIEYTPNNNSYVRYDHSYGLGVVEFSDDAYYKDTANDILFFGGINGLISVQASREKDPIYNPNIILKGIRINGVTHELTPFMKKDVLTLTTEQNFFTILATTIDYINNSNYEYKYQLKGFKNSWFYNSQSSQFTFTNIPPGSYTLKIAYHNKVTNFDSEIDQLKIKILPPWYLSIYMKLVYWSIILFIAWIAFRYYLMKKDLQKQKREKKIKELLYESKMDMLSKISNEFAKPLTLMDGYAQQLSNCDSSDIQIKKYIKDIRKNTTLLKNLISTFIEFKNSGKSADADKLSVTLLPISKICEKLAATYNESAVLRKIDYNVSIEENIIARTDKDTIVMIVNVFLSKAFKYVNPEGTVSLFIWRSDKNLMIKIGNTGPGIEEQEKENLFDKHYALDRLNTSTTGSLSKGAMEINICYDRIKRLGGEIKVSSKPNDSTCFIISLPASADPDNEHIDQPVPLNSIEHQTKAQEITTNGNAKLSYRENIPNLFILSNDKDIMNFISSIFVPLYNTYPLDSLEAARTRLEELYPDIVICIISKTNSEFLAFMKNLKGNKKTFQIPVITLSSIVDENNTPIGLEYEADVNLSLPFEIEKLKQIVEKQIKKTEEVKDYFHSPMSAFKLTNGKIIHQEDKAFADKLMTIIKDNISNPDISTEKIASLLGISSRSLYRKLTNITDQTPANIIKEYRLIYAEQLLITTKLSISEIMYQSGFSNRGTFFKNFIMKNQCTPKQFRDNHMKEMRSLYNTQK